MRKAASFSLIALTMACFALVNILIAQGILRAFYPGSGLQLGSALLAAVGVVTLIALVLAVRGWRSYIGPRRATRDG